MRPLPHNGGAQEAYSVWYKRDSPRRTSAGSAATTDKPFWHTLRPIESTGNTKKPVTSRGCLQKQITHIFLPKPAQAQAVPGMEAAVRKLDADDDDDDDFEDEDLDDDGDDFDDDDGDDYEDNDDDDDGEYVTLDPLVAAIESAINQNDVKLVKQLIEANPKFISVYWLTNVASQRHERVALLLVDEYERLHGSAHMHDLLAGKGGPLHITPLHCAVWRSLHALARRLLEFKGFNQLSVDTNGFTVLHHACSSATPDAEIVAKVLEMDPSAVRNLNRFSSTPFDVARAHPLAWLAELLQLKMSFDDLMEHENYARENVPSLIGKFVRQPLSLILHHDVVLIVCGYLC